MSKRVALLAVVLFAIASAVLMVQSFRGSSRARDHGAATSDAKPDSESKEAPGGENRKESDPAAKAESLKSALGSDDGFASAIFYGADLTGNLETCG